MNRILERLRRPADAPPPHYIPGARMYCVGDIHGRPDLLDELHAKITEDAAGFPGERHVLYLGDYVDRGPDSRGVVDRLLASPLEGFERIHLKGNHEQALLDFLDYPRHAVSWLTFGGRETLASYGIAMPLVTSEEGLERLARDFEQVLPPAHRAFFEDGLLYWKGGDYLFVHAGIRPGVAVERQHPEDLMWIREEFTQSDRDHGAVVVHGHTISPEPEFLQNRIGIDTGAFYTGVLTCLVLEGSEQRTLQTGRRA